MILTLWLIFILWAFKYYRPPKPKHKAPPGLTATQIERNRKQAEREQAATEKRQAKIRQAELTIGHCMEQLEMLTTMHRTASAELDKAIETVKTDKIFQAARTQKVTEKHLKELEKAQQKVFNLNAKITAYQIKLDKAQNIINNGG